MSNDNSGKLEMSGYAGGQGAALNLNRRDTMTLARRAIKNNWPISDSVRQLVASKMAGIVKTSDDERQKIAAAKVLVAADSVNVKREALDQQAMLHADSPSIQIGGNSQVNMQFNAAVKTAETDDLRRLEQTLRESLEAARSGRGATTADVRDGQAGTGNAGPKQRPT